MDKWYLSENGRVTGPFNIDDVQRCIAKNSDLYGWNPSYSHWLPVVKIKELSVFLPEVQSSEQVSKALIDKFVNKKQDLNKKVALINSSIGMTVEKMVQFEQEINKYKELTTALSSDVKDNIVPLEKKHNGIGKQLNDLQKALAISKQEINDVVKEFGDLVLNKVTEKSEDFAELAQATPVKPAASVTAESKRLDTNKDMSSVVSIKKVAKETEIAKESQELSSILVKHQLSQDVNVDLQPTQPTQAETSGFKNKLKSVFGKQNNTADLAKLSERLLLLEKEVIEKADVDKGDIEEEVVFLDYEVESESVEQSENEPKKKRRRRRF